jgi:putative FmdB family regulatory protein
MPIYEYKCRKCGKKFEVFQKITDDEVKQCTACNGPVDKLISLSSFHLKGSGWYVTDYGGKKPAPSEHINADKKDTTGKTESSGTSDTKTTKKE